MKERDSDFTRLIFQIRLNMHNAPNTSDTSKVVQTLEQFPDQAPR